MSSDADNQSSDAQIQRILFNVSGDVFMDDATPLALSSISVSESRLPSDNPFSTSDHSDQYAPLDYDMKGFQVHDEMPLDDLDQDAYSQQPQISYPYVDYDGWTPYPDTYLPGSCSGPLNDHGSIFTDPPQPSIAVNSQSQIDPRLLPPTPITLPPAPQANVHKTRTPTKTLKKPKKKTRNRKSKSSKGKAKEKSFPCTYAGCPRVSTCASNLADHLLTHTNIRDYPCEFVYEDGTKCTKSFPRPWGLHRHYGDTHKMDVKVEKKNGLRKPGRKGGMEEQKPLPDGLPPTITRFTPSPGVLRDQTSSTAGPYTPPPTVRLPRINNAIRINITTQGPKGPFPCCGTQYADANAFMVHNHFQHSIPYSSFCCCDDCENTRAPAFDTNMDIGSSGVYKNIDPQLLAPFTPAAINRHDSVSSPALSSESVDEAPVYTPTESLPDAKFSPNTLANVTFDTDMLAPLSPMHSYGGLELDHNKVSEQEGRGCFVGQWDV